MKEKRDCKLVQDLLPNYIDKLTNEDTNIFIEEHLKTCEECKDVLDNMQKEIELKSVKKEDKEINYIKKYSIRLKIFKVLSAMFLLVVLFFILSIERRMVILTSLMNKVKEIDYSNSYVCIKSFREEDNNSSIIESYLKDDIELWTIKFWDEGRNYYREDINYYKNEEEQFCIQKPCNFEKQTFMNEYLIPHSSGHGQNMLAMMGVGMLIQTPENYFDYVFNSSIESVKYEGEDCYIIKKGPQEVIIEKATGLLKRIVTIETEPVVTSNGSISYYSSGVLYYDYSFGTVTDKDIQKPDISGYKKYGE